MGYTHYWTQQRPFTDAEWTRLCERVQPLFADLAGKVALGDGRGTRGTQPDVSADVIRFNGVGAEAHETFTLKRQGHGFDFCKTAGKPYDLAVCGVLIVADTLARNALDVSSDGNTYDWQPALEWVRRVQNDLVGRFNIPRGVRGEADEDEEGDA